MITLKYKIPGATITTYTNPLKLIKALYLNGYPVKSLLIQEYGKVK